MAYEIVYYCLSHIGLVRKVNQDNYVLPDQPKPALSPAPKGVISGRITPSAHTVFGVFDGMGGEECGEMASFIAARSVYEALKDKTGGTKNPQSDRFLRECCVKANHEINSYVRRHGLHSAGTTAAMLQFSDKAIHACNIGDSRIFRLNANGFRQISEDHVFPSPKGMKAPLYQYLGLPENESVIDPKELLLKPETGDLYLIATDGLTDMVSPERMEEILKSNESTRVAEALLAETLKNGGRDNVTFIVMYLINH